MKSVFFAGLLLAGSVSVAQTDARQEPDREVVRKHTHEEFDGATVVSEGKAPTGIRIIVPRRPKFESMVQVRTNFDLELHRSVDAL